VTELAGALGFITSISTAITRHRGVEGVRLGTPIGT